MNSHDDEFLNKELLADLNIHVSCCIQKHSAEILHFAEKLLKSLWEPLQVSEINIDKINLVFTTKYFSLFQQGCPILITQFYKPFRCLESEPPHNQADR